MKFFAILAMAAGSGFAFSADLVSTFDFEGNLNATVNVGGHAGAASFLHGGADPTVVTATYSTATVGAVTKQVLNFAAQDTIFALHGIGSNGGGTYVNQYSILMDVKFNGQASGAYASLFNTSANNSNDGDSFLKWGSGNTAAVGIQGDYQGSFSGDTWHRLVITTGIFSDRTELNYFSDGVLIASHTSDDKLDERFPLYSYNDNNSASDGVFIFGDEDGENGSGQISKLAFFNAPLDADSVKKLGGVGQPVPEPSTFAVLGLSCVALLRRRKV